MATSNPAFSNDMFAGYEQVYGGPRSTTMTVQGTAVKTLVLLAILAATATWSWKAIGERRYCRWRGRHLRGSAVSSSPMITIFKPTAAPVTAPIYAAFEGVFLGAISQVIEQKYRYRVKYPAPAAS